MIAPRVPDKEAEKLVGAARRGLVGSREGACGVQRGVCRHVVHSTPRQDLEHRVPWRINASGEMGSAEVRSTCSLHCSVAA